MLVSTNNLRRHRQGVGVSPPKPKKRKEKEKARVLGPAELRGLAEELRRRANDLEIYAEGIEEFALPPVKALMGNWKQALEKIDNFLGQQIIAKLLIKAYTAGSHAREFMRRLIKE